MRLSVIHYSCVELIQDRATISPQLKESWWLLHFDLLTDLAAELSTYFKRVTEDMEGCADGSVLTHFPGVQSPADNALDACVYITCIDKLLKEFVFL